MSTPDRRHWEVSLHPYFSVDFDAGVFGWLEEIVNAKDAVQRGRYGDAYDDMLDRAKQAFAVAKAAKIEAIEEAVAPKAVRRVRRRAPQKAKARK